jgi:hypothetical protein
MTQRRGKTQLRGRAAGLVAVALAATVIAGCGGHKSPANTPAPAGNNAPAAQSSTVPSGGSSSSSGGGGYGY